MTNISKLAYIIRKFGESIFFMTGHPVDRSSRETAVIIK